MYIKLPTQNTEYIINTYIIHSTEYRMQKKEYRIQEKFMYIKLPMYSIGV
jgi:hypothetical protein